MRITDTFFSPSCNGHFTVVGSVPWPLNGSEAGGDLVFVTNVLVFHT